MTLILIPSHYLKYSGHLLKPSGNRPRNGWIGHFIC